jgi:hypothetical protein
LDLLDIKIGRGIFESDCKNTINIQSANPDEIFITNLPEKFSFIEVVFNCSYRKFAITNDYSSYNQINLNLDVIEDRMTELLLRNKKLFDDSICNFVYANEKLEFENKNIITKGDAINDDSDEDNRIGNKENHSEKEIEIHRRIIKQILKYIDFYEHRTVKDDLYDTIADYWKEQYENALKLLDDHPQYYTVVNLKIKKAK